MLVITLLKVAGVILPLLFSLFYSTQACCYSTHYTTQKLVTLLEYYSILSKNSSLKRLTFKEEKEKGKRWKKNYLELFYLGLGLTIISRFLLKKYKFLCSLFYNCTFITLNFIRPVLKKYSRVLFFNTLLYSNTSEILILYSSRVFIFTSILYSTRVVKFQYFTQHWDWRCSCVCLTAECTLGYKSIVGQRLFNKSFISLVL